MAINKEDKDIKFNVGDTRYKNRPVSKKEVAEEYDDGSCGGRRSWR